MKTKGEQIWELRQSLSKEDQETAEKLAEEQPNIVRLAFRLLPPQAKVKAKRPALSRVEMDRVEKIRAERGDEAAEEFRKLLLDTKPSRTEDGLKVL